MKILNLFAGIGGNRSLWGNDHQITAVENNQEIANIYQERFPNDTIIVGDAYEYLENHFNEFDLIWASPPCQSHSKMRTMPKTKRILPDMRLYSLIIFLQSWYKGKWVVENVGSYYSPLIQPSIYLGRHPFWVNFVIKFKNFDIPKEYRKEIYNRTNPTKRGLKYTEFSNEVLSKLHHIDFKIELKNKRQILRNCVMPEVGKYVLDQVLKNQIQRRLPL